MKDVVAKAKAGTPVIGICNGFQILCESGLLPGALLRNASLHFICRDVFLKVENNETFFTKCYRKGEPIKVPIAHGEGNYFADNETLDRLEGEGRVAFGLTVGAKLANGPRSEESEPISWPVHTCWPGSS